MKIEAALVTFKDSPAGDGLKFSLPFFPKKQKYFIDASFAPENPKDWMALPIQSGQGEKIIYLNLNSAARLLGTGEEAIRKWHQERRLFPAIEKIARAMALKEAPEECLSPRIQSVLDCSAKLPAQMVDGEVAAYAGEDSRIVLVNQKTKRCWDLFRRQEAVNWRGKIGSRTVQIMPSGRRFIHIKSHDDHYASGAWKVCKFAVDAFSDGQKMVARLVTRLHPVLETKALRYHLRGLWILHKLKGSGIVESYGSVKARNKRGEKQLVSYQRFYRGGNLYEFLRKNGRLCSEKRDFIAKRLLEGMNRMHRQRIYHRDLKEENILIDVDEKDPKFIEAAICDFDLSWTEGEDASAACGTAGCLSPERAKAYQSKSAVREEDLEKYDVWSMGLVLYSIYHGRPLSGVCERGPAEAVEILSALSSQKGSIFLPSSFPIDGLILKMLQIDPADRIGSAEALREFQRVMETPR